MAHLEGETSNTLFEVLADWNDQLNHCYYYENSLGDEPDEFDEESDDFEEGEPEYTPICKPRMGRRGP